MTNYRIITADVESFVEGRETSNEIGRAILEFTYNADADDIDLEAAESEWENGYNFEKIVARAWEIADDDEQELHWGAETITR